MEPTALHSMLVLASSSPRRKELMERLGLTFSVQTAGVDESLRASEPPRLYVERLAREKAEAVAQKTAVPKTPHPFILAADTTVVLNQEVLGKPESPAHAEQMLKKLSGQTHSVLTAVALRGAGFGLICVETRVKMRRFSDEQIRWYLSCNESWDKAGAYAFQGVGALWVESIEGSPTNVIGLPLPETVALLESAGFPLPWKTS